MGNPMILTTQVSSTPQAGQAYFLAGEPVMPTGVQFEGVKFFESTNFPSKSVTALLIIVLCFSEVVKDSSSDYKQSGLELTPNAQVLINNNDDFADLSFYSTIRCSRV